MTLVLAMTVGAIGCSSDSAGHAPNAGSKGLALVSSRGATAPEPSAPATTALAADPTAPAAPSEPATPTLDGDASQPPPTSVVAPPSAFLGLGMPQPGSFFQSLLDDHSFDGQGKFVALTFDDGPGPYTRRVVDVLNLFGVKATFFQIADQVERRVDLLRYMKDSGMHIASHSKSHQHLPSMPAAQQATQIVAAADLQDSILGPGTVKCFRPPYGQYDQTTLDLIAQRGLATAMWSVDTDDWRTPGVPTIVVRALKTAKDRSMILMHDGGGDRHETIEALPWIITALRNRGFSFIPVC